jgi:hypothetical protein
MASTQKTTLQNTFRTSKKGKEAIGHAYAISSWQLSHKKPAASKRKTPPNNEGGGTAKKTKPAVEDKPAIEDNSVQPRVSSRPARQSKYKGDYTEATIDVELELEDASEPMKKKKGCDKCDGITAALQELVTRSDELSPTEILKEVETMFDKYHPDLGKVRLLPNDDDTESEDSIDKDSGGADAGGADSGSSGQEDD